MSIILHKNDYWNNLNKNSIAIPLILVGNATCLYYLFNDIHEDLEGFITTGRSDLRDFHAFPEEKEKLLISHWEKLGFIITHHIQRMEYMGCKVSITYLKVKNPETGLNISLLPWFLLPDRPYPIFMYIYAIWYYQITGKESLSKAAAVTSKLFGVEELHKSTVSRNIKALENIIDTSRINEPLEIKSPEQPSDEELDKLIPEILNSAPSIELLEKRYGEMVKHLPPPINRLESVCCALSDIPPKYSEVLKEEEVVKVKSRDVRKRPPRPRREESECVQRPLNFIESHKLRQKRKEFVEICRCLVLDAAISYHRFLI